MKFLRWLLALLEGFVAQLRRIFGIALLVLVLVAIGAAVAVKARYGGGSTDFPNLSTAPMLESGLQQVASLQQPPGNIAVAADGRIFFSFHPAADPDIAVAQLVDGKAMPFPNAAWQPHSGSDQHFYSVLSLRIDRQNRLWVLDNGKFGLYAPRLLAFDLNSGNLVHRFTFPPDLAGLGSHVNDFQVSPGGRWIYIADDSLFAQHPALIVYDSYHRRAWRALDGDISTRAENYIPVVNGREMQLFGLFSLRPGVDSIALDAEGEWLYFAAVTARKLYRIRTADLRNRRLSAQALAKQVEVFAPKSMSDGLSMDTQGNIYITDPEHSALQMLKPDGSLHTLIQDARLRWPDGLSFGPDGWLYVTCSALQDYLGRFGSAIAEHAPYAIYRLKAPAAGIPGH